MRFTCTPPATWKPPARYSAGPLPSSNTAAASTRSSVPGRPPNVGSQLGEHEPSWAEGRRARRLDESRNASERKRRRESGSIMKRPRRRVRLQIIRKKVSQSGFKSRVRDGASLRIRHVVHVRSGPGPSRLQRASAGAWPWSSNGHGARCTLPEELHELARHRLREGGVVDVEVELRH